MAYVPCTSDEKTKPGNASLYFPVGTIIHRELLPAISPTRKSRKFGPGNGKGKIRPRNYRKPLGFCPCEAGAPVVSLPKMTAKQKALEAIASLPDDTDPQDIVSVLIQIYRIQRGLILREDRPRATQAREEEANTLSAKNAQVAAWRQLAGQWQSERPEAEEIEAIYAARTSGRKVDL